MANILSEGERAVGIEAAFFLALADLRDARDSGSAH